MDFISIIILLGIAQGIFLGVLLIFLRSPNRRANRFLGILFFAFSVSISHFFFLRTGLYEEYPHLLRTAIPSLFLFGPLYYGYVRILTDRTHKLRPRDLLHLLPFILVVAVELPFYVSPSGAKLESLHAANDPVLVHGGMIIGAIQVVHISAYITAVIRILRAYDRQIRNTKSSIEAINLRWLRFGTMAFIGVFGLILIMIILQALGLRTIALYSISIPLIVSGIIYTMGYLGLRQPEIFSPTEEMGKKYERSALTPDVGKEYLDRLQNHMEIARPYLDSDLTLPRLAEQLSIPPHHLSQLINESLNQNFFDFVNGFRVEEAKRLLLDPSKAAYTVLAIAGDAGFNSKTAFNAAFKRLTGKTPSEYRAEAPPAV